MFMKRALLIAVPLSNFFLASVAFSSPEQMAEDYQALRKVPSNYEVFGTVCEEVARLRLEKEYAGDTYNVLRSIEYKDKIKVLGELDVVVFERSTNEAILIGEVKCWDDFNKALQKAKDQLNRFENAVENKQIRDIYLTHEQDQKGAPRLQASQFDTHPRLTTISYDGGEAAGFDSSIGLTMEEVKELRDMLMGCKGKSECGRHSGKKGFKIKLFETLDPSE